MVTNKSQKVVHIYDSEVVVYFWQSEEIVKHTEINKSEQINVTDY